jgi:hypothetical protein
MKTRIDRHSESRCGSSGNLQIGQIVARVYRPTEMFPA